jgi:hypothetical protein
MLPRIIGTINHWNLAKITQCLIKKKALCKREPFSVNIVKRTICGPLPWVNVQHRRSYQ